MSERDQIVLVPAGATSFSAVCAACGAAFAGRLDADLRQGLFLCRRGHAVRVEREQPPAATADSAAA